MIYSRQCCLRTHLKATDMPGGAILVKWSGKNIMAELVSFCIAYRRGTSGQTAQLKSASSSNPKKPNFISTPYTVMSQVLLSLILL